MSGHEEIHSIDTRMEEMKIRLELMSLAIRIDGTMVQGMARRYYGDVYEDMCRKVGLEVIGNECKCCEL